MNCDRNRVRRQTGQILAPAVMHAACRAAVAFLLIVSATHARAGDPPSRVFVEGEDLIYNVRYGFVDLGQVRIKVMNPVKTASSLTYEGKAYIDSYPKVPFVDLHAIYESVIDTGAYSLHFIGRQKGKGGWDFGHYNFEYDRNRVLIEVGTIDSVVTRRDTLSIGSRYNDGLSLFFFARDQLFSGRTVDVPTIVMEAKVNTVLNFKREHTSVEVDGIDYPVDVIGFDGNADFVGIFGLTGGFEGWFSNDDARVPIMAKMKVIIGSVTIELMKWTRPGWTPPRAMR